MGLLWELTRVIAVTFALVFINPIFWAVMVLVLMQYRRVASLEKKLFGRVINSPWIQLRNSLALGTVGGAVASALLTFFGLSLEQIGLVFIWPVAILLLLLHPRFLCFAYAGGIVALGVLGFRAAVVFYPALAEQAVVGALLKVHIPSLLVLVALLHLMESLLISLGGYGGCSPIYVKNRRGEVVGGFSLQRFWPLPLVALLVTVILETEIAGVSMPEWWPILSSTISLEPGQTLQYMAVPVAAGLGYSDLALSSSPREKTSRSAGYLALYSLVLLAGAIAAEFFPVFTLPAVLLSPLGHELVILAGSRREMNRPPRYTPPHEGVQLLAVLPGSAATRAGLQEGDLLLRVNGTTVSGNDHFLITVEQSYFMVLLEGERRGEYFQAVLNKNPHSEGKKWFLQSWLPFAGAGPVSGAPAMHRGAALGLILVPDPFTSVYVELRHSRRFFPRFRRRENGSAGRK